MIQIDGVYLLRGKGEKYDIISENTQGLRSLAMELHVPIMGTTQYSRKVKGHQKPEMQDLLYAGENSARQILAFRKVEINPSEAKIFKENWINGEFIPTAHLTASVVRAYIIKNTNGRTGNSDEIKWVKSTNHFKSLTEDWRKGVKPTPEETRKNPNSKNSLSRNPRSK